jgi:hypothetical protein
MASLPGGLPHQLNNSHHLSIWLNCQGLFIEYLLDVEDLEGCLIYR